MDSADPRPTNCQKTTDNVRAKVSSTTTGHIKNKSLIVSSVHSTRIIVQDKSRKWDIKCVHHGTPTLAKGLHLTSTSNVCTVFTTRKNITAVLQVSCCDQNVTAFKTIRMLHCFVYLPFSLHNIISFQSFLLYNSIHNTVDGFPVLLVKSQVLKLMGVTSKAINCINVLPSHSPLPWQP